MITIFRGFIYWSVIQHRRKQALRDVVHWTRVRIDLLIYSSLSQEVNQTNRSQRGLNRFSKTRENIQMNTHQPVACWLFVSHCNALNNASFCRTIIHNYIQFPPITSWLLLIDWKEGSCCTWIIILICFPQYKVVVPQKYNNIFIIVPYSDTPYIWSIL